MLRRLALVIALLLTPALVACSSTRGKAEASPSPSSSSTENGNWAEITSLDVRFELPEGWDTLDSGDVAGSVSGSDEAIEEIADRMGVTVDQFKQIVEQAELWAFAAHAEKGFLDNVNVLNLGGIDVPNEGAARLQLRAVGAELSTYESVSTPVGEGASYEYTLSTGGSTVQGAALVVSIDGEVLLITYSAGTADTATAARDLALDTLESTS